MRHDPRFSAKTARRIKAAELILHLLISEDLDAWIDAPPALARRMSENDLKGLAFAALRALPAEEADDVIDAILHPERPAIIVTDGLDLTMARAEVRQMGASSVKAMGRACVERMPPRTRTAFVGWIQEKMGRA